MHPNFLREEAARFRGMAGRELSQLKLMKMAADHLANVPMPENELQTASIVLAKEPIICGKPTVAAKLVHTKDSVIRARSTWSTNQST